MANILNLITIGEKKYLVVDANPADGAGTSAEVGSLAVWEDGSNVGRAYIKTGSSDTAWDKISTAADGGIAVGDYLKLPIYNTNASGQTLDDAVSQGSGSVAIQIEAASRSSAQIYTVPAISGASASFVLTEGAQTINGDKTFGNNVIVNGDLTVNGSLVYLNSTNTQIKDKLITLNKGGAATSAGGSGLEFEENSLITGYLKVSSDRNGYELLAPNVAYSNSLSLANLSAGRVQKFADASGTFVMRDDADVGVAGQVAFYKDANKINSESNLFWDAINDRLGISTNAPSVALDVNGSARVRALSTGVVHSDSNGNLSSSAVSLTADVSGVLPIANGGTNSSTALNNNRIMISSSGAIVEHSALTQGSVFFANANGLPGQDNANFFWDSTNAQLGIGINSSLQAKLHIRGSAAANVGQWIEHTGANTNNPFLSLRKQRAGAAVQSGDTLGSITFAGYDGSSYIQGAQINGVANENYGVGANGTRLLLRTVPNATATAVTTLQLNSNTASNHIVFLGGGTASSAQTGVIKTAQMVGTDLASGSLTIKSGESTGTGLGGIIAFQVSPAGGVSGSSSNSSLNRLVLNPDGKAAFYSPDASKNIGLYVGNGATSHNYILPLTQGAANSVMHNDGSGNLSWAAVSLTADVSGVLPIANGGTNSSAALNNNRIMISSSGAIVEHSALTQGSVFFADANGLPGQDNANLFWDDSNNRLGIGTNAPARSLDVNGSSFFRGSMKYVDSSATKANWEMSQAQVSTTDATVTTLASISVASNSAILVQAQIVGRRTGGTSGASGDSAVYIRSARFKNVSGTVTILNLQSDYTSEDQASWNGTLDVSGTSARIRVNAAANNNVDWTVTYTVITLP